MKKIQKGHLLLLTVLGLGLLMRILAISHNHIFFYFDQARDATVSRQILEQKDLKIMGPSVSGTQDSVYHGVLYYYLIAPAYYLGQGNPYYVALLLIILGTLSIGVTYQLGKEVFHSKATGLMAAFIQAVSVIGIHQSTWLSNPSLSGLFVPLTYYFIWLAFFGDKKPLAKTYVFLGLAWALSVQSALQNITIAGSIIIALIYAFKQNKRKLSGKKLFLTLFSFLLGISTMILTEVLMFKRGILSFDSLRLTDHSVNLTSALLKIIARYYLLLTNIFSPLNQLSWLIVAIVLGVILFALINSVNKKQLIWSFSYFLAPIWLLLWHYRDPNHTFIGIDIPIFLLLAHGLISLTHKHRFNLAVTILLLTLFAFNNIRAMSTWRNQEFQYFGIQKGAFLVNQLKLIDTTYELSGKGPFSFSSLTSPYLINTTWNYLYKWYGQQKYGYTPYFVGVDQDNFVGHDILPQKPTPEKRHFAIIEPDTTLSQEIQNNFFQELEELTRSQAVMTNYEFGTLSLKSFAQDQ